MQKILIIGGTGMLGHMLCRKLPAMGYKVFATTRGNAADYVHYNAIFGQATLMGDIDVTIHGTLENAFLQAAPDIVINCAGIIRQRPDSKNRYLSIAVNSLLPHRLSRLCKKYNARLIHISTDCVFDGLRGQYREDDASSAADLYGKTKYLGETDHTQTNAVTIRTSLIGRELNNPKYGLVEWFLAQNGKTVQGYDNAIFTGVTTYEMARIISIVIQKPALFGLFQVASAPISKYDLLTTLKHKVNLDITIEKDTDFLCNRSLIMDRFTKETGYKTPDWNDMLSELAADKTPYDKWN